MASTTQRLKYYDGEYLQSGDFTDEQSYHVAMRRLLNQQLHLHGIVKGLHIVVDAISVPSSPLAQFLSVSPGFAIDQVGREIYVTAPVSLTPLLSLAGLQTGTCEIWIVYTETASGSPAPGYQLCNQLSQNTRWTESFSLMLRNTAVVPAAGTPNPNLDLKGLCLGLVNLSYNSTIGFYFTLPPNWYSRRSYVKIRAQSIIAPDDIAQPDPYVFYGPVSPTQVFPPPPEGYIHIKTPLGVYSDGSMLVQGNMLIGDDFALDPGSPAGANLPPTPLPTPGNLKVGGDLFVLGSIFAMINNNWTNLDTYFSSQIPDVQIVSAGPIGPITGGSNSQSVTLPPVTSVLKSFKSTKCQAMLTSFSLLPNNDMNTFINGPAIAGENFVGLSAIVTSGLANPATIEVTCTVGPPWTSGVATNYLINTVSACVLVIFYP